MGLCRVGVGGVVSTVASQQEGLGFKSQVRLHVLPVPVWG